MATKSISDVEESVQGALEALPSILRSSPATSLTRQLGEALAVLVPAGYRPVVELQENGRRKRRTASADNWTPETGKILISFSKDSSSQQVQKSASEPPPQPVFVGPRTHQLLEIVATERARTASARSVQASTPSQPPRMPAPNRIQASSNLAAPPTAVSDAQKQELCRALDEVERQGRAFIALKWFRDEVLPSKGFAWVSDPEHRQAVLAEVIAEGLIVTSRVPNPRSPFPTTSIRLNRAPVSPQSEGKRYSPVRIQGEPLSSTILRDRGTY
jgi:hypothetical protein